MTVSKQKGTFGKFKICVTDLASLGKMLLAPSSAKPAGVVVVFFFRLSQTSFDFKGFHVEPLKRKAI